MRGTNNLIATAGLLGIALLPMIAAVPPEPPASPREGRMPVAIAAIDSSPILVPPVAADQTTRLPEPGMLVLVGSALLGLAAIVRKTT